MTPAQQLRFLCGQAGINLVVRYFFTWHLKFADQRGPRGAVLLDASIVGLGFFAARIFDAVTDPLAGLLCDRWVERGKARSRLLWYAFWIAPLSVLLIFMPSHGWSSALRWAAMIGGMFLFFIGYTFYAIPYWSLVRDYARDPVEEQRNSEKLGVGLLVATAGVAIGSPLCIAALGYLQTALIFAAAGAVLMVLPIGAGQARPRDEVAADSDSLGRRALTAFRHRRFLAVLCLFSGSQMAFTVMTAGAPFIVSALLGGSDKDVAKVMAPLLLTALPFSIFFVGIVSRGGWQRAATTASIALGVVYAGAGALGQPLIGSSMTTAMVLFALAGPMVAVILGLEAKAVVDCAKEKELQSGGERTSLYFGVFNFTIKALNGMASMIVGLLVGLSHRPGWEVLAVRAMGFVAGLLLVLGVGAYFLVNRSTDR